MRRVLNLIRIETLVQLRYRIPLTALVMTVMWAVLLLALPAHAARTVAPFLLLLDTATFGAAFLAALVMLERADGSWSVLRASPVRFGEYVGARFLVLTGISALSAVAVALAATSGLPQSFGPLVAGVTACTLLFLAVSFGLAHNTASLARFLVLLPIPTAALIVVPLARMANLLDHPLVYLVPTTGAAQLIRDGFTGSTRSSWQFAVFVGYLLLWSGAILTWAHRRLERGRAGESQARSQARRAGGTQRYHPILAFARIDLGRARGNGLLPVVVLAPLLLALALRFGYPSFTTYLLTQYGFDLRPYQDVVVDALVLLHVPLMVGTFGAILLLDDVEDRTLLLMRTSPVTLRGYLGYRLGTVAAMALVWLIVAVPLSGLTEGRFAAQVPALVTAAVQAPLIALLVGAATADKVRGIALLKVLGGAMVVIPLAVRFLPAAAGTALLLLPPAWPVHAMPPASAPALLWPAGGVAITLLASALLWRRTTERIERSSYPPP